MYPSIFVPKFRSSLSLLNFRFCSRLFLNLFYSIMDILFCHFKLIVCVFLYSHFDISQNRICNTDGNYTFTEGLHLGTTLMYLYFIITFTCYVIPQLHYASQGNILVFITFDSYSYQLLCKCIHTVKNKQSAYKIQCAVLVCKVIEMNSTSTHCNS